MGTEKRVKVTLNGKSHQLTADTTIESLLQEMGVAGRAVAVELNQAIVPREDHNHRLIHEGDWIEVVSLVGGG